jgi:hypothetical protein
MSRLPTVAGLLVCEQLIVEERTRSLTPVNSFTTKNAGGFPSEPQRFTLYASLVDGLGEFTLTVAIRGLEDFEEIYRRSVKMTFTDPLQEGRFVFRITDCSFPQPGFYEVGLSADGDLIGQRRFLVQ